MGGSTARSASKCSATSMRLSADGRSGSSSGSNVENARRCTGWGASRGGTPTCSSCGSSACDRRLEGRSRMRREFHVRFCEGGGVRAPSATRLVILSRGHAAEALAWTTAVMTKLGLTINEAKTSLKDARRESFDFLGYTLGPRHFRNGGRWYLGAAPSKKSVRRVKRKISDLLRPSNTGAWLQVCARLNRLLGGWAAYFSYGSIASAYQAVDRHLYERVCAFLRRRHKTPGRGTQRFPREYVYGELDVLLLNRVRKVS